MEWRYEFPAGHRRCESRKRRHAEAMEAAARDISRGRWISAFAGMTTKYILARSAYNTASLSFLRKASPMMLAGIQIFARPDNFFRNFVAVQGFFSWFLTTEHYETHHH